MGDNLKAASRFVHQSISSLDHITTSGPLSHDSVLDKLADLQRGAKAMRARAIYRAAQSAVDMVHKGQADDKVNSELHIVRSLVVQYQHGLQEILDAENALNGQNFNGQTVKTQAVQDSPLTQAMPPEMIVAMTPAPVMADPVVADPLVADSVMTGPVVIRAAEPSLLDDMMMPLTPTEDTPLETTPVEAASVDVAPAEAALTGEAVNDLSQNMIPLVQFAPEAEQRDALRRLSRLHDDYTAQSQRAARHERLDMAAKPASKPASKQVKMTSFESLMPELTNVVLTTARHLEKTVSISYAALGVELNMDLANKIRLALSDLSVLLVNRSLEAPQVRRARGESGAGHISVMASVKAGELKLSVECTGRDITAQDLEMSSWKQLEALGAVLNISRDDNRLCLGVTGLRVKASPQKTASMPMLEQAS